MRLTVEQKKAGLIGEFTAGRVEILMACRQIPPEKHTEVFLGSWCVLDLLAHLAGWDDANREAAAAIPDGRLPEFYHSIDPDWRTFNAMLVSRHRRDTLEEQIGLVQAHHRALVERLQETPAVTLFQDFGVRFRGYKVTVARMIESETHDEKTHLGQIQDWLAGKAS